MSRKRQYYYQVSVYCYDPRHCPGWPSNKIHDERTVVVRSTSWARAKRAARRAYLREYPKPKMRRRYKYEYELEFPRQQIPKDH